MTLTIAIVIKVQLLLLAANGSPVLAKRLFGERWTYPLDGGLMLFDGYRLLGASKTVRGLVASLLVCAAVAPLLGFSWVTGALFGLASMTGDAFSSFIKRRINIPPSGMAFGLDQIPEALLPILLVRQQLALDWLSVVVLVLLFIMGELLLSRVMYHLGVRDRPY